MHLACWTGWDEAKARANSHTTCPVCRSIHVVRVSAPPPRWYADFHSDMDTDDDDDDSVVEVVNLDVDMANDGRLTLQQILNMRRPSVLSPASAVVHLDMAQSVSVTNRSRQARTSAIHQIVTAARARYFHDPASLPLSPLTPVTPVVSPPPLLERNVRLRMD